MGELQSQQLRGLFGWDCT